MRLFHNGEVCSEVYVKNLIEAEHTESSNHLALYVGAHGVTEFFAKACSYGRSGTCDNDLFGICDSCTNLIDLLSFVESAGGANVNTLTACYAGTIVKLGFKSTANDGLEATLDGTDNANFLNLAANCYTTTAENALGVVTNEVRSGKILFAFVMLALVLNCIAAVLISEVLKLTVSITVTGEAGFVMVRENKLDGGLSRFSYLGGIGKYFHTLVYGIYTGSNE